MPVGDPILNRWITRVNAGRTDNEKVEDILCKDIASGQWVIIENQMGPTNHAQLGQLITYAARLKGVTIAWIAEAFSEKHRATLNWLNEITDSSLNTFGLEVELWRIGDSAIAPKFNVVCKPDNWTSRFQLDTDIPFDTSIELKRLQEKFWTALKKYAFSQDSAVTLSDPLPQSWINASIVRGGFHLAAVASFDNAGVENDSGHELRVELTIDHEDSHQYFALLESKREEIEANLGETLFWHNLPEENRCRIYIGKPTNLFDEEL